MNIIWNSELYHYGMPRRSGRYPWGSGKNPFHHGKSARIAKQKKKQRDELTKYKQDYNKRQQETIRLSNKDKDFIMKSKNSKLMYRYRDQFTENEINSLIKRVNTEKTLSKLKDEEVNKGRLIIRMNKKIASKVIPISKGVESTVNVVNRFKKGAKLMTGEPDEDDKKKKK